MDFMNSMFHDLKFHVNHFIVGYKQRYYSMDNNPRVIQTKLQNQQLLSLRTFPNDKHLIDDGQPFLHITKESSSSSPLDNIIERDLEHYKNTTFKHSTVLKKSYSEPNLVDGYFSSFRLQLDLSSDDEEDDVEFPERNSLVSEDLIENSSSPPSGPCTCHCHSIENNTPDCLVSKKNYHVKEKFNLSKVTSHGNNEPTTIEMIASVSPQQITSPQIELTENNIDEIISSPNNNNNNNNKIWKLVLNDISLSAARLSTGSSSIPIVTNQNIRGDFIDAKIINNENEDIFTSNLHSQLK
ncbi:hypothetical protein SBY92_002967 [Candida maltosa Xu316]